MAQFSEVSTRSDSFGGSVAVVRNHYAELILVATGKNAIVIQDRDGVQIATFTTDKQSGWNRALIMAENDSVKVING